MAIEDDASTLDHTSDWLDVDESAHSDTDSGIDTDWSSLTSASRNYVYENGRRYHSPCDVMPNDETEQERLDLLYHAMSFSLGGALQVVELPENLDRALDVGTGTGIWAIDFADQHPECEVIGVDLSSIQPSWVPPNCTFEVDDVEDPWTWEPFDFIHSAYLAQGIRDWPQYTKRIFDNLTPGGVVQLHEASLCFHTDDDSIPKGGYLEKYQNSLLIAAELSGFRDIVHRLEPDLLAAGFSDVRVVFKKMPIGSWPKDPKKKQIGKLGLVILEEGLRSYGLALFTRELGMSVEDAEELCENAFSEIRRPGVHTYSLHWFVEGRKPAPAAST